jgi:ABC-2 type transport system permease protein
MNRFDINVPLVKLLVAKDWQLFEKQLALYVAGGIVALCLLGMAQRWSFYVGSLVLIIVLVSTACFAISNSLLVERKERTLAFVMSLPVTPMDFHVAKLIGNLVTFGVPFLIIAGGAIAVVLLTPLPDGLVVYGLLIFGHIFLAYCVSLSIATVVESEGWNTFAMISSMVLINPFMMVLGQIPSIADNISRDAVVWTTPAVAILAVQMVVGIGVLAYTTIAHCRKPTFY